MVEAGDQIDALIEQSGSAFSGVYFDNGPSFRLVVRLVGAVPPNGRLSVAGDEMPVEYVAAQTTLEASLAALTSNLAAIRTLFPTLQATSYDERRSEAVVLVKGSAIEASLLRAKLPELQQLLRVPVRLDVRLVDMQTKPVRGGVATYLVDGSPWCTTAFVGKNSSNHSACLRQDTAQLKRRIGKRVAQPPLSIPSRIMTATRILPFYVVRFQRFLSFTATVVRLPEC